MGAPNKAVEDGSANPLRSFAAHLTAALGQRDIRGESDAMQAVLEKQDSPEKVPHHT